MFIRYHLIYFAIGCLLSVLSKYFHPVFFLFLCFYLGWIAHRLGLKYVGMIMLVSIGLFFIPMPNQELPTTLEGTVMKTSLNDCYVQTKQGMVKLYHENDLEFHDHITVKIEELAMNENTNDYAFNEKLYLYGQKVFYKARVKSLIEQTHHYGLYQMIENHLSSKQDVQDYQRLFLLGEKSDAIEDDYQMLSQLSLVHLFALSGMHVHLLYHLFKKSLGLLIPPFYAKWISYLLIGFYVFSIPMQISLYRAFFVMILYELFKKWFHELDVLSFLTIISLYNNPYYIYNVSFVFSYFIYFIVLLTKHLCYSSSLIYLSSVPIVLFLNYQIPLFSFLFVGVLTPYIEILYQLCCLSLVFPILQIFLEYGFLMLQSIIRFLDASSFYLTMSRPTLGFLMIFYVLYFVLLYKIELHQKWSQVVCMMIALMISFGVFSQYKLYGEVTMIDVGQGDCTLIRLPMNQGNILIDTGGNQDYDLATKTIIPYLKAIGIRKLDYVYISHSDYDHCGALTSLKEHFCVEHVIDSYEKTRQIGCMQVTMLESDSYSMDTNDQSLIMKVDLPAFSILFTGDASSQVEKDLKAKYQHLDIDILKVSHHGSQSASSSNLLSLIEPSIAMIGVKKNNLYHHPSPQVIERLKRKNIKILRTDEDGMFHIRFYGKSRYIFR